MRWLERIRRDLPGLAVDVLQVGAEKALEAHGVGPAEAKDIATVVGVAIRDTAASVQSMHSRQVGAEGAVLRIASPPDPSVTPCLFVYAMPIQGHRVREEVLAVGPRLWLSPQTAWIYAEHLAYADMGVKGTPKLILGDETAIETDDDDAPTRIAWEQWRCRRKDDMHVIGHAVPFGSYVFAETSVGVIAWRAVLTPRGMRLGTFSETNSCSLDQPPKVFASEDEARKALAQQKMPAPIDVFYMPRSLAAEIHLDEGGKLVREKPAPQIWQGDPVKIKPERRLGADPDPVLLRPDWYVSRDHRGGVWAWQPVGDGQVSFARIRDRDGEWKTARWSSVGQCLQHLGALGQFGQEHPTLTVSPGLAVRRPARDYALEPDL